MDVLEADEHGESRRPLPDVAADAPAHAAGNTAYDCRPRNRERTSLFSCGIVSLKLIVISNHKMLVMSVSLTPVCYP